MNNFLLIPLFAGVANLVLAFFVFTRDPRLRANQVFLLWGAALGTWNLGAVAMFRVTDPAHALLWARLIHMGVIFVPVSVMHLSLLISRTPAGRWLYFAYAFPAALAVSNLTPFFIEGVRQSAGVWWAVAGPGFWAFAFTLPFYTTPTFALIWRRRAFLPAPYRRRLNTLLFANALLMLLGTHDLFPVLGLDRYPLLGWRILPWGTGGACVYGVLVAYSVLHDQLLDIRVSLGRQAATLVRLVFLVAVAYILLSLVALALPDTFTLVGFGAALVVLLISAVMTARFFPRLLGGGTETIERSLLGDSFEYQQQLRFFSSSLAAYGEYERMLDETATTLHKVLGASTVQIVLLDAKPLDVRHTRAIPPLNGDWAFCFRPGTPVYEHFAKDLRDRLDLRNAAPLSLSWSAAAEKRMRASLSTLAPEFVIPIYTPSQLLGFIALGRKSSGAPFTTIDLELLADIARQLGFSADRIRVAERESLLAMNELLAGMGRGLAHDLFNLAQPVQTFLQLEEQLADRNSPRGQLLDSALHNIQVLQTYLKDHIFFAQDLKPKFREIALRDMLEEARRIALGRAHERIVDIAPVETIDGIEFTGDRTLLLRVLVNLLHNAVDASAAGQVVHLRGFMLQPPASTEKWLRISVEDEGSGIAEEHKARLFQPFFSTKNVGSSGRGTGLGLTTCKLIVVLHNGMITLQGDPGRGATAEVDLPVTQPEKDKLKP